MPSWWVLVHIIKWYVYGAAFKNTKTFKKYIGDYTLCIIYLNALHLKDARVLQSCMSEGSLLNLIHPLCLKVLLLTCKFCLCTYNLFALLKVSFLTFSSMFNGCCNVNCVTKQPIPEKTVVNQGSTAGA